MNRHDHHSGRARAATRSHRRVTNQLNHRHLGLCRPLSTDLWNVTAKSLAATITDPNGQGVYQALAAVIRYQALAAVIRSSSPARRVR
jgi:hypothetical protein